MIDNEWAGRGAIKEIIGVSGEMRIIGTDMINQSHN